VVVSLLSCISSAWATDVYKWKDADGRTHVSDRAPARYGAERVRIETAAPPVDDRRDRPTSAAPRVVMLSASWCGVCRRARNWLTRNGVAFTEYDVERDRKGMEAYKRLNGKGVPIILVGDLRMDGFSATALEAMLARARK
jgi:glutaredoxin